MKLNVVLLKISPSRSVHGRALRTYKVLVLSKMDVEKLLFRGSIHRYLRHPIFYSGGVRNSSVDKVSEYGSISGISRYANLCGATRVV